jgi:hypothetical protein
MLGVGIFFRMKYFIFFLTFSSFAQSYKNQILKIENRTFVLFSKENSEKELGNFNHFRNKKFITVDSSYVKKAINELYIQSCEALKRFQISTQESTFERIRNDGNQKELRLYSRQVRQENRYLKKICPKWNKNLRNFNGQILAYINEKQNLILWIQLFNFATDPSEIKSKYEDTWITGFGDWFETNVSQYYFNNNTNKISINEEL